MLANSREVWDVPGPSVDPCLDHGAVEAQPDDILIGQAEGHPNRPSPILPAPLNRANSARLTPPRVHGREVKRGHQCFRCSTMALTAKQTVQFYIESSLGRAADVRTKPILDRVKALLTSNEPKRAGACFRVMA